MQKVNFQNLPNTTTPINADNLNQLQNNVENDIGDLSNLETEAKTNLVEAINEANQHGSGGGGGETLPVGSEIDFDGTTSDIPVGWEQVTNPDSYSTSEVKTNKVWIDGKPIYKKVVELPNITSTNIDIGVACNISNLWQVINIEGIIYINNSQGDLGIPLNFYNKASQDYSFLTFYRKTTSQIIMRVWTATKGGFAILYYTKTTD